MAGGGGDAGADLVKSCHPLPPPFSGLNKITIVLSLSNTTYVEIPIKIKITFHYFVDLIDYF